MRNKFLLMLFALVFMSSSVAYAAQWFQQGAEQGHFEEVNCDATMDCNQQSGKMEIGVDPSPTFAGDVTANSTLILAGRVNGVYIVASSSTGVFASSVPYALIIKHVGGTGVDDTDGGIRLADGIPGQELTFQIGSISGGSGDDAIVTPNTSTGWDSLTFDAVGEYANLLYVDDTIGWIIKGTNATRSWTQ